MRALCLAALLAAFSIPAGAQSLCAGRDALLAALQRHYGERLGAVALTAQGRQTVELLTAGEGGTWTLLLTSPDRVSCVIAAGGAWHHLESEAEGEKS